MNSIEFMVKSNRAFMFPVYKGTYERKLAPGSLGPSDSYRRVEFRIQIVKDLRRAIDYLETRPALNLEKLAYYGASWGAHLGILIAAVEPRLKVCVLYAGGFNNVPTRSEVDEMHYAPRVTIPVLMLNGRYDSIFPHETSQIALFRFLGTPEKDKRHVVYEAGHVNFPRIETIKETLDWLDRYQGVVE